MTTTTQHASRDTKMLVVLRLSTADEAITEWLDAREAAITALRSAIHDRGPRSVVYRGTGVMDFGLATVRRAPVSKALDAFTIATTRLLDALRQPEHRDIDLWVRRRAAMRAKQSLTRVMRIYCRATGALPQLYR